MPTHRRLTTLVSTMLLMFAIVTPASATGVVDPAITFVDDYEDDFDFSNYILDRHQALTPPYSPLLEAGTADGRTVMEFTVDGSGPTADFYRYQGFKRQLPTGDGHYHNGAGTCLETTFKLDPAFASSDRLVSFWPVTNKNDLPVVEGDRRYPIAGIEGFADDSAADSLVFWVYPDSAKPAGWNSVDLPAGFDFNDWHTFTYVLTPNANVWYLDGDFIWADPGAYQSDQTEIGYQIFNNRNSGEDYTTLIDSFRAGSCSTLETKVVEPGEMEGWAGVAWNTANGGFTEEFGAPVGLGTGSWQMDTGDGDGPGMGGKSWLYTNDLNGTKLAELVELSYWTYVSSASGSMASAGTDHLAPAINIQVDLDDDGDADTILVWEPVYVLASQGDVIADTWQEWDALDTGWWHTTVNDGLTLTFPPFSSFNLIGSYLVEFPDATIVESSGGVPGFGIQTGQGSGGSWAHFVGAVDGVTYGIANSPIVTIDVEAPTVTPVDADLDVLTPAADADLDLAVNLSGINGSILIPDLTDHAGVDVDFDWELLDGATIVDSGSSTVAGGDPSVTITATVPGAELPTVGIYPFTLRITSATNAIVGADAAITVTIPDTTAPVITLVGDNPQVIEGGDPYVELGATATDDIDGDISSDIVIDVSGVDTSTPGAYKVTYNVTDTAGNKAAEVTRSVTVVAAVVDGPTIVRLGGANRYGTARSVADHHFDVDVDYVFIATGENHPDALVAAAPAGYLGAPVLLVTRDSVEPQTLDILDELDPGKIFVIGGASAISDGVASTLAAHGSVERIAGADRYATATEVSERFYQDPSKVNTVFIATGITHPDALVAAAPAGRDGAPILLVPGTTIPASVKAELERLDPDNIVIVGGAAAVSESVEDELEAYGTVIRIAGADRFDTADAVATRFYTGTDIKAVFVATAWRFPDALVAAAPAGSQGIPVLLASTDSVPSQTLAQIERLRPEYVYVVGGPAAITDAAVTTIDW